MPSLRLQKLAKQQSNANGPSLGPQKDASITGELQFCHSVTVLLMRGVTMVPRPVLYIFPETAMPSDWTIAFDAKLAPRCRRSHR